MRVRVRLFASLREAAGRDEVEVEVVDGASVGDVVDRLRDGTIDADARFAVARNQRYAALADPVEPGDELALIPPVSGG